MIVLISKSIKRLLLSLEEKFGTDFLDFFKHGSKYSAAKFIIAGVGLLNVVILTRLLTTSEYGLLAVFNSTSSILTVIFGFQMYGAVGRYYQEKSDDFGEFLGTALISLLFFFIIEGAVIYYFHTQIFTFLEIPENFIIYLLLLSGFLGLYSIYMTLLVVSYKSTENSIILSLEAVVSAIISVFLILNLDSDRHFGRINGRIITLLIALTYIAYRLAPMIQWRFKLKHIKYALRYVLPGIPGGLSVFIMQFFDKIIINQIKSAASVGLYTLAWNFGFMMHTLVGAFYSSYGPKFIDYLRENKRAELNQLSRQFAKIVFLIALTLTLFSKDLIILLAPERYHVAAPVTPIVIFGYALLFIAQIYGSYAYFRKEKIWVVSLNLIVVTFLNIYLNYKIIPVYGYIAAAVSTAIGYFLLLWLNYFNARIFLKEKVIPLSIFWREFFVTIVLIAAVFYTERLFNMGFWILPIKIIVVFGRIYWIFRTKIKDDL